MWEIQLSKALYNPNCSFVKIFELIGEGPALLPMVYFLVVLVGVLLKKEPFYKEKKEYFIFSLYLILVVTLTALIVGALKNLWQRTRFFELDPFSYSRYTPFWQFGKGGSSFPSGHASMSALSLLFLDVNRKHAIFKRETIPLALGVVFTLLVCLSRLMAGAHYITDLIFGVGVALLVRAVVQKAFKFIYKSNRVL